MSRRERKSPGRPRRRPSGEETAIYAGDSFFTLAPWAQAALVILSLALAAGTIAGAFLVSRRRRWPVRLLIGLGLPVLFEWLSPQAYYVFYRTVIEGLPRQWVLLPLPQPAAMLDVMLLGACWSLSAHGRALLYWVVLIAAICAGGPGRPGSGATRRGPARRL